VSHPGKALHPPILCYVTDRKCLVSEAAGDGCDLLLKRIAAAASAGVDWIQIREKDLSGKEYSLRTREALLRTKRSNRGVGNATRILVNDRLDVALAERTGGVHLGEHSLPVRNIRQWVQASPHDSACDKFLVGVSCHSLEAAASAARDGADYIFFGPVFATPSKAVFGSPQGVERLAKVCSSVSIPVLAIGGITRENTPACLTAGATGIAAIRLFQDAEDLPSLIAHLRAACH
jgi:thiamine-phosphate pyrophosphorylase